MSRRLNAQEQIDSLTMKINNPNIRGSGYIEHPPQVPFAGKVVMQPSTVNTAEEAPEWFIQGPSRPQRDIGHPPAVPQQRYGNATQRPRQEVQMQSMPLQHRGVQNSAGSLTAKTPQKSSNADVKTNVSGLANPLVVEEKKLSKAAKAKLRKKMREGKI